MKYKCEDCFDTGIYDSYLCPWPITEYCGCDKGQELKIKDGPIV